MLKVLRQKGIASLVRLLAVLPLKQVPVFISATKMSSSSLMPLNISVSFTFPSPLEISPICGFLEARREQGGEKLTGYLDVLLHFALECTISGAGSQSQARFQAAFIGPGATDHLPLKIKVNGRGSGLERSPGAL